MSVRELVKRIRGSNTTKEFAIFIIIGIANTFNSALFASILTFIIDANIAFVIGYILALIIAYFLNSRFTFKKPTSFHGLLKFGVSYIPNFIIQNLAVLLLYNALSVNQFVTYAAAAIIGTPLTFLLLKGFAYKTPSRKKPSE